MRILKRILIVLVLLAICSAVLFFNVESVQKKAFDMKADLVGSDRTVTFYSKMEGTKVASFSDKDTRYEVKDGTISVWLGSKDKKVHSNMDYIIEDNK